MAPGDFCHSCGAQIPHRYGEGTCIYCDPHGVIKHYEDLVNARIQSIIDIAHKHMFDGDYARFRHECAEVGLLPELPHGDHV